MTRNTFREFGVTLDQKGDKFEITYMKQHDVGLTRQEAAVRLGEALMEAMIRQGFID